MTEWKTESTEKDFNDVQVTDIENIEDTNPFLYIKRMMAAIREGRGADAKQEVKTAIKYGKWVFVIWIHIALLIISGILSEGYVLVLAIPFYFLGIWLMSIILKQILILVEHDKIVKNVKNGKKLLNLIGIIWFISDLLSICRIFCDFISRVFHFPIIIQIFDLIYVIIAFIPGIVHMVIIAAYMLLYFDYGRMVKGIGRFILGLMKKIIE